MKVIYKYPLHNIENRVALPIVAKVVHFGICPEGQRCLWVEVEPSRDTRERIFHVFGTGWSIPLEVTHLASMIDGGLVLHLYEQHQARPAKGESRS